MPEHGIGPYAWVSRDADCRSGVSGVGPNCADASGWDCNHPISDELHRAFAEWVIEFEKAPIDRVTGSVELGWKKFHGKGIVLSRRLKRELGDSVCVIYQKSMDDPGWRFEHRREVRSDGALELLPSYAEVYQFNVGRLVKRMVSGGQTGADRAALDFAIEHGIEHGGWCPKGWSAEDGRIPKKYQLQEMPGRGYRQRTKRNVIDSDGTLILNLGELEGGSLATLRFAEKFNKTHLVVQLDGGVRKEETELVLSWLRRSPVNILNVAGPRESKRPEIYRLTYELMASLLDEL